MRNSFLICRQFHFGLMIQHQTAGNRTGVRKGEPIPLSCIGIQQTTTFKYNVSNDKPVWIFNLAIKVPSFNLTEKLP